MQTYGGKFSKKSEETRERILREKISVTKTFFTVTILSVWLLTATYFIVKYFSNQSWNADVVTKTRDVWKGVDKIEMDLMNSILFLKGCRKDMVFQETENGFVIQTVESRGQSMEVLRNAAPYNDQALPVYLGPGIRQHDELILCNAEEEKKVVVQTVLSKPKYNFHYLISNQNVSLKNDLPSVLIKFTPAHYRWEKQTDGSDKLFRMYKGKETEVLNGISSHKIDYSLSDKGTSSFTVDLTLVEKFKNGDPISIHRDIPLESFQRLPAEFEEKMP